MRGETSEVGANFSVATKKRAGEPDAAFTLLPHVCRHCFGRLVRLAEDAVPVGADGRAVYRYACSSCGAAASGAEPSVLCACGLTTRALVGSLEVADAGLRCVANPSPSPEFPALFVAMAVKP